MPLHSVHNCFSCLFTFMLFSFVITFLSFGSPDDWESFLNYLGCLLEDDSYWCRRAKNDLISQSNHVDYKISHLADEVVRIYIYIYIPDSPIY